MAKKIMFSPRRQGRSAAADLQEEALVATGKTVVKITEDGASAHKRVHRKGRSLDVYENCSRKEQS